jgi:hypothetical protein
VAPKAPRVEKYGLDPAFERVCVTLASTRPRFYSRVGFAVEAEGLGLPAAQLVMKALHAISKDLGHGPDSPIVVLQRLRRWQQEGTVEVRQIAEVATLYEDAMDTGLPDEETVLTELAAVVRRRMEKEAIGQLTDDFAKKRPTSKASAMLERAAKLGEGETSTGMGLGGDAFDRIESQRQQRRLPIGIMELDGRIERGVPIGTISLALADTGEGKSQFLISQACNALWSGLNVAYATLELSEEVVSARAMSNLTGIPTTLILEGDGREACQERLSLLEGKLGIFKVCYFTPQATTPADLKDWIDRLEKDELQRFDLLCVDYINKLVSNDAKDTTYITGRKVTEGLRIWAKDNQKWVWTAGQVRRKERGKSTSHVHDTDDGSDSKEIVRVADFALSLNIRDEGASLLYYVAKNRYGPARFEVGPQPHDWEYARTVFPNREDEPWTLAADAARRLGG